MWKFLNFSITKILREINFRDSKSAKSADFDIFGVLNFAILVNFNFQKVPKRL